MPRSAPDEKLLDELARIYMRLALDQLMRETTIEGDYETGQSTAADPLKLRPREVRR